MSIGRILKAASVDSGNGTSSGAQECDSAATLDALNALRAEHDAPPLSWSADLAQQAVDVVRQQADNPSCQFQVRGDQFYLWWGWGMMAAGCALRFVSSCWLGGRAGGQPHHCPGV